MAIRLTGMASGMDTDTMVKDLVAAYRKKGEKLTKTQTKTEWKQEAWTELNNKVKTFFNKYASEMRFSSAYAKKKTDVSDSSKASVLAGDNAVKGSQNLKITELAKSGYLTGAKLSAKDAEGKDVKVTKDTKLSELGFTGSQKISIGFGEADSEGKYANQTAEFDVDGDMTIAEFAKLVNNSSSGISASFDEANGRLFVNSTKSGKANDFHFVGGDDLSKLTDAVGLTGSDDAVRINGSDAEIYLNGAKFTSETNIFTINGLTITAKDKTTGEGINLSTDTDYDGIYDQLKDFFKEYNSLVNEMSKLYNAASSKGFDPLTSEEKEEMTDDEVEKWEGKIKDSLLRYDQNLNSVMNSMINPMLSVYEVNGTKYSLSSFGIETLGYFASTDNERNAYHIDGDEDDSMTAGKTNKLKAMIASNPEDTAEFFQKLVNGLYQSMNDIQKVSDDSKSYGSFFEDKQIKDDITAQKKKVTDWESKIADIEEKYYKQFAAMESAMTKLNSQQSSIASLFGGQ